MVDLKSAFSGVRHVIDIFMTPDELREIADDFEREMKEAKMG